MIGIETLIAAIIALFAAIAAWVERQEAKKQEARKETVIAFFDPENDTVTNANDVPEVPRRSHIMGTQTKAWVLQGHGEGSKGDILKQIAAAEEMGLSVYYITWSDPTRNESGYYKIEWGLLGESGKGPLVR